MVSRSYSSGILKNGNRIAIQKVNVQISNVFINFSSDFRSASEIFSIQVQMTTDQEYCVMELTMYKCWFEGLRQNIEMIEMVFREWNGMKKKSDWMIINENFHSMWIECRYMNHILNV